MNPRMSLSLIGLIILLNKKSQKKCKRLVGRMRGSKRKRNTNKVRFQYDPLSYALNFDDRLFIYFDRMDRRQRGQV
ncbi:hypothetical protein IHE45_19G163800 [Dioscorea alata]|uniref:Uncharacterized protein n=1 Tax=Dioscorea alata TaxID=55571 RepID=A0ACB7U3D8_DIOAL|nr:hypothetical protein IHE45_19G163800 [Dioscorea alata]